MRKRIKIHNRMFMEAEHSFYLLKFYYDEMNRLIGRRAADFQEYTNEVEEDYRRRQRPFDRHRWLRHFDLYADYYPRIFDNSFMVCTCAQFEYQIKRICSLVKEEHNVPLEWDDMSGSVPKKAKRFLWYGEIVLKDNCPDSLQHWFSVNMPGAATNITAKELWRELEDYFRVRNCIAHHNGLIERMRYPKGIISYASSKGILATNNGQKELSLNQIFNREVCDIMKEFFSRLTSAYYDVPLPE